MGKSFNTRIQQKIDTAENWAKATNFTPLKNELIIYDKDNDYDYYRFKIGDGATNVNNLPFADWGTGDWNQNDDTSSDYIKNRTHWFEPGDEPVIFLEETSLEFDADGIYVDSTPLDMVAGDNVIVEVDGVEYACEVIEGNIEEVTFLYLGNGEMLGLSGNDEPFMIIPELDMNDFVEGKTIVVFPQEAGTHVFKISKPAMTIYHKLSNDYLNIDKAPIKNSSNLITSGAVYDTKANWYENNSSKTSYIENRTHWAEGTREQFKPVSWDGNTEGLEVAVGTAQGFTANYYYKVAGLPWDKSYNSIVNLLQEKEAYIKFYVDTFQNGSQVGHNQGSKLVEQDEMRCLADRCIFISALGVVLVTTDNCVIAEQENVTKLDGSAADDDLRLAGTITFPTPGIYFCGFDWTESGVGMKFKVLDFMIAEGDVYPLYDAYIPDTIARISDIPTADSIIEKLTGRLLPDPTQLEDGTALVVRDGKWVLSSLDAASVNGINIQVANEAPSETDETNPTITFVV